MIDNKKELIKLIEAMRYKYSAWQVFSDFVEMAAISVSNAVDFVHHDEREKRYMEIIKTYEKKDQAAFPQMLSHLVSAMEDSLVLNGGPTDILGQIFHELELHNKWKGQFFTPVHVCEAMGMMTLGDYEQRIKEKEFLTVGEPCVGSGAMILGFAKAMKSKGLNYCSQIVVTAQDVDLKCVHMAYVQFSLYGIPAVVIHGNTLTVEEWSRWYTTAYMVDGWIWRSQCSMTDSRNASDEVIKRTIDPIYNKVREIWGYGNVVDEDTVSVIDRRDSVNESPKIIAKVAENVNEQPIIVNERQIIKPVVIELNEKKSGQLCLF